MLREMADSDLTPAHGDPVAGEVRDIVLDVSRAKQELGWQPKTSLEEGMKKTVEWTKKNQ